jgi:hypothetical protein
MGGTLISYRRDDSADWKDRLSEHLKEQFEAELLFRFNISRQPKVLSATSLLAQQVLDCSSHLYRDHSANLTAIENQNFLDPVGMTR